MIIVSDTSPLTNLLQINQVVLLKQLFQTVIIPFAVYEELCEIAEQAEFLNETDWIKTEKVPDTDMLLKLKERLDKGEAESIALAVHLGADYLLIDEIRGRAIAEEIGIRIVGFLGVLIKAKASSLLPAVRPLMDDLINKAGFYIQEELYERVLAIAHEDR